VFLVNNLLHIMSSSGIVNVKSIHIPLKDVHGVYRMVCVYLSLLCHLCLVTGLEFVLCSDVSMFKSSQDDFRLGGVPSLFLSAESMDNSKGLCGETVSEIGRSVCLGGSASSSSHLRLVEMNL
jgi:hypothetical protein